jgi:predicted alpha/beta superfamily hydrolase
MHSTYPAEPFLLAKAMSIPSLRHRRRIWAYLPATYHQHPNRRYPVVYFNDGQNVFDAQRAFGGTSWETHATASRLAAEGLPEAILIGIEHGEKHRIAESTPFLKTGELAPEANAYADFVVNTLKPFVDRKLRTQPDRAHTALIGSSMGGLITLFTGLKHQDVLGTLGVFSPSFWIAPPLRDLIAQVGPHYPLRTYIAVGATEAGNAAQFAERVHETMQQTGFSAEQTLLHIRPDGHHHESYWQWEFDNWYRWWVGGLSA